MSEAIIPISKIRSMKKDDLNKQPKEALITLIDALRRNSLAALGDGEVFVLRDGDGVVEAVRAPISLTEEGGHLYGITTYIDGKKHRRMTLTAPAYYAMNKVAGVNIVTPTTVKLPTGEAAPNPYMDYRVDARRNRIPVGVWVRKTAVGFSPVGNIVQIDATLYFDLDTYFLQDVLSKIHYTPECGRVCVEGDVTEEERQRMLVLSWNYGVTVIADPAHKEIQAAITTQIQRQKFAERIATTICERNALKKHPALAVTSIGLDKSGVTLPVIGWVKRQDDMRRAVEAAANGDVDEGVEATVIDLRSEDLDTEDLQAANADMMTDEDYAQENAADDDAPPPSLFSDNDSVKDRLTALGASFGEDAVKGKIAASEVPWKEMTKAEKLNRCDEIYEELAAEERGA